MIEDAPAHEEDDEEPDAEPDDPEDRSTWADPDGPEPVVIQLQARIAGHASFQA